MLTERQRGCLEGREGAWKVSPKGRREHISNKDHTEFLTNSSLVSRESEERKSDAGGIMGHTGVHGSKHPWAFKTSI
jgi:hypothetical protein